MAYGWRAGIVGAQAIAETLELLELPKSMRSIRLVQLQLGPRPPTLRSLAAAAAVGPTPHPGPGCMLQTEVEWIAPGTSATLAFQLANVASQPRLRVRRLRLRGTLRVHWEWIAEYPYVGRVRYAFVRPPEVSDVALEPIGTLDVTSLPGVGAWIRDALRSSLATSACLPNWLETNLADVAARTPPNRRPPSSRPVASPPRRETPLAADSDHADHPPPPADPLARPAGEEWKPMRAREAPPVGAASLDTAGMRVGAGPMLGGSFTREGRRAAPAGRAPAQAPAPPPDTALP